MLPLTCNLYPQVGSIQRLSEEYLGEVGFYVLVIHPVTINGNHC